jgi:electron transport complex protein RnfB
VSALVEAIDRVLPQTQCTKCGYPDCRAYAQAVARGDAGINQCAPGGDRGIRLLAAVTGRPYEPLDPTYGEERPRQVAMIDEARCIGCTLCIRACPVDAIVGAAKLLHTVVADLCTGCELCVAPCPVDCIAMEPASGEDWDEHRAADARVRYDTRAARQSRERAERVKQSTTTSTALPNAADIHAAVEAAFARARARRSAAKRKP